MSHLHKADKLGVPKAWKWPELCQVFYLTLGRFYAQSYVKYFKNPLISGVFRLYRVMSSIFRVMSSILEGSRFCGAQTQNSLASITLGHSVRSKEATIFSCIKQLNWATHWLLLRICGLFIHRSYWAFLYAVAMEA
jgi:hypothetical protein